MSLAIPNVVLLDPRIPDRRKLVFAACNGHRANGSISQIQAKAKMRRSTVMAELEALEWEGLFSPPFRPLLVRERGRPNMLTNKAARIHYTGKIVSLRADLGVLGWTRIATPDYQGIASWEGRLKALDARSAWTRELSRSACSTTPLLLQPPYLSMLNDEHAEPRSGGLSFSIFAYLSTLDKEEKKTAIEAKALSVRAATLDEAEFEKGALTTNEPIRSSSGSYERLAA